MIQRISTKQNTLSAQEQNRLLSRDAITWWQDSLQWVHQALDNGLSSVAGWKLLYCSDLRRLSEWHQQSPLTMEQEQIELSLIIHKIECTLEALQLGEAEDQAHELAQMMAQNKERTQLPSPIIVEDATSADDLLRKESA